MITIESRKIEHAVVRVPGSKSYTHRLLIGCALASGKSTLADPLVSEDTRLTARALGQMGARIQFADDKARVTGTGGRLQPADDPIFLKNSGTSMRLLTALAGLGRTPYRLTGSPRMHQRPIGPLLDSLNQIGVAARSENDNSCPPVLVDGINGQGGAATIGIAVQLIPERLVGLGRLGAAPEGAFVGGQLDDAADARHLRLAPDIGVDVHDARLGNEFTHKRRFLLLGVDLRVGLRGFFAAGVFFLAGTGASSSAVSGTP